VAKKARAPQRAEIEPVLRARLTERGLTRLVSNEAMHVVRGTVENEWPGKRGVVYRRARGRADKRDSKTGIWLRVNEEIHDLICTQSSKYAVVRKALTSREFKASQKSLAILIAGGVAAYIGLSVAVILPFVAMALLAFIAVSRNTYCAQFSPTKKRIAASPRHDAR